MNFADGSRGRVARALAAADFPEFCQRLRRWRAVSRQFPSLFHAGNAAAQDKTSRRTSSIDKMREGPRSSAAAGRPEFRGIRALPRLLPTARPRGWSMSVINAATFLPIRCAGLRPSSWQDARLPAGFFINAPEPVLTSSTSASIPSASFLLMMLAQISAGLSTVPVTSRNAYIFLSAGTISAVWPDHRAPGLLQHVEKLVRRKVDVESGDGSPTCPACRRCGPGRAR